MISLIVVALVGIGFTRLTMLALELRDNFDEQYGGEQEVRARARARRGSPLSFLSSSRARAAAASDVDGRFGNRRAQQIDIGRRRIDAHDRMRRLPKPVRLIVKEPRSDQFVIDMRASAGTAFDRDLAGQDECCVCSSSGAAQGADGARTGWFASMFQARPDALAGADDPDPAARSGDPKGGADGGADGEDVESALGQAATAETEPAPKVEPAEPPACPDPAAEVDSPLINVDKDAELAVDPQDACVICFEKAKNAVLLGCGHGGICYNCSIDVYVTSGLCPFCRQDVSQIVMIGLGTTPGQERAVVQVVGPK